MLRWLPGWLAFVATASSCGPSAVVGIDLAGIIYTDLRMDSPCVEVGLRPELAGVALTFTGPDDDALGAVTTGPLQSIPLEPGSGTEGWDHHGCRFFASYALSLPVAASYTVTFAAPEPADPRAGTFTGVRDLKPQTATYAQLEAQGFEWSFEALPSYVA